MAQRSYSGSSVTEGHSAVHHRYQPRARAARTGLTKFPNLARFTEVGGLPMTMTASELGKLIANETEKWHKVIEFAGISIN